MGLHHGPNSIVETGLTLCLDPANKRSYAGSGTSWKDCVNDSRIATMTNMTFENTNGGILNGNTTGYASVSSTHNSTWAFGTNGTIDAWAYITGAAAFYNYIFSTGGSSNAGAWDVSYYASGVNRFYISGGNKGLSSVYSSVLNTWQNFTFVVNSGLLTVYMNNVSQGAWGSSSMNLNYGSANLQIGANIADGYSGGVKFGQFKIYNRALTTTEISQNFNALRGRYGV